MTGPLLDYQVGLLRGYLLAHNAPTQILHALDLLLADYRSKAGPVIGARRDGSPERAPVPQVEHEEALVARPHRPPAAEEPGQVFTRWSEDERAAIVRFHGEGKSVAEIAKSLPGRSYQAVYAKMTGMGLIGPRDERRHQPPVEAGAAVTSADPAEDEAQVKPPPKASKRQGWSAEQREAAAERMRARIAAGKQGKRRSEDPPPPGEAEAPSRTEGGAEPRG